MKGSELVWLRLNFVASDGKSTLPEVEGANFPGDEKPMENRMNIPLQYLYEKYNEIPTDRTVYKLCSSGDRSTTAASFLVCKGFDARVITGGLMTLKNGA